MRQNHAIPSRAAIEGLAAALIDYLDTLDAPTEDMEPTGDEEPDHDREDDTCDTEGENLPEYDPEVRGLAA